MDMWRNGKLSLFWGAIALLGAGVVGSVHAQSSESLIGNAGLFCEDDRLFSYIRQDDGSINFGLEYWFESGAHCGLTGNAHKTDSGWLYETEDCKLDISVRSGSIILETPDEEKLCQSACGSRGYLQGLAFPVSSRVNRKITPQDIMPENLATMTCSPFPQ